MRSTNQSSSSAGARAEARARVWVGWGGLRDGVKRRLRFLVVMVPGVEGGGLPGEWRGLVVDGVRRGGGEVRRIGCVEDGVCDGFGGRLVDGGFFFRLWTLWP